MKLAHLFASAMAIACGLAALGGCQSIQGIGNLPSGDGGAASTDGGGVATTCQANSSCTPQELVVPNLGGNACPQTAACPAAGTSSYIPSWKPPKSVPGSCSAAQVSSFFDACIDRQNLAECTALEEAPENAGCVDCLQGAPGDAQQGAYILYPSEFLQLNVAGCVALKEPCNLACAKAIQAESACALDACDGDRDATCSIPGVRLCTEGTLARGDCGCGVFSKAAGCYQNLGDATKTACPLGKDPKTLRQDVKQIALTMCGPCP